ncbi:MAG: response regulator transcription factor [Pseudonocardiales bacterium]
MSTRYAAPARRQTFSALVVAAEYHARASIVTALRAMGAGDIAEASTPGQARTAADESGPRDVAVVDLQLPGGGLKVLADLRNAGWAHLLAVSPGADAFSLRAAYVAGADGYLFSRPRLRAAVSMIPSPRSPAGHVAPLRRTAFPAAGARPWRPLSAREIEVLRLVAVGQSNNAAGEHLQLSALTVKSHLARIARKLGTGDRAHMVAVAMRAGLIA